MPIVVDLAIVLATRRMKSKDLAALIDISEVNLSQLKNGHVQGIRFSTLEKICKELKCQPGDILRYEPDIESGEPQ